MKLESTAFHDGEMIPERYTCDGEDISPPLNWKDTPDGTKSYALIVDDPDAPNGTFVHWVVFNIPAVTTSFEGRMPPEKQFPTGIVQGRNDFDKIGYGGPCPPSGTHRYFFKLYALDRELDLTPGCTKQELLKAIEGAVLGEAELVGKYQH